MVMAGAAGRRLYTVTRITAILALVLPSCLLAAGPTADLARRILDAGLDPEECYRVRDLRFARDEVRVYLTDGYLVFGKPVNGVRLSAVFSGEMEGGDAEVLVMPPQRAERVSLAAFANTPNLDEHFSSAIFLFTDDTYPELLRQIGARPEPPKRTAKEGALMAEVWQPVLRNLVSSFQLRAMKDLLSDDRPLRGFFYAAVSGRTLDNFDVMFDPRAREQVTLGRISVRDNRSYFDVWTRFRGRSFRNQTRTVPDADVTLTNYRIDASLDPKLRMRVATQATITPGPDGRRAVLFDISPQMRVTEVRIDGAPVEVFQRESLRSSLIRGDVNETFLVVPPQPLEPGRQYEIEFRHDGEVITDAGNNVYFVGARGAWYPNRSTQFAKYDLTFRYPKELDLVATGKVYDETVSGPVKITRRRTDSPVRMAGFNLGRYEHEAVTRGGYTVEVYANRRVEPALQRGSRILVVPPPPPGPPGNRRWTVDLYPFPMENEPPTRLEQLALEIANGLEFMASRFGAPVLRLLTVAPIPGTFGQGFPGLIYLSTLAYLDPTFRPPSARSQEQELFYSEILHTHETAHQWWGNVVTSASAEDEWLMEALANYSALLYLEKRKGQRAAESVLARYKERLLRKTEGGKTVESAGPIIWGPRLYTSQTPGAWRVITYEKGSWIIHMLRRRMGDERFLAMLGQLRRRYQFQPVTTDEFRKLAAEFLPPKTFDPQLEAFFDQWVYQTGVPSLKLNYSVKGKAPAVRLTGAVTQADVDGDFSAYVPVEIQMPKGRPVVEWVRTSSEGAAFSVALRQAPSKVSLDPGNDILRR